MIISNNEIKNINVAETWKPYPKNPKYEISDEGRVRRKYLNTIHYLESMFYSNKSAQVAITKSHSKTSLARAVWETFRGEIPKGYVIQHKNGCKSMCDVYNLYLVKQSDFLSKCTAEINKKTLNQSRTNRIKVIDNQTGIVYNSMSACARALYVDLKTIKNICNGSTKQTTTGLDVSFYDETTQRSKDNE